MEEWRGLVAPHRKPRGLETTESHWRAHIQPELGHLCMSRLTVRRVQQFVNKISPGRSGKLVENIVLTLTAMLRHANRWDDGVRRIHMADLIMPERVKPILIVLAMTGLRINEALALRIDDLNFHRKIISVRHSAYNGRLGTPKTKSSVADLHIPPELEKALQEFLASSHYRKNDMGLLFCNREMRPYSDNKLRHKMLRPLLHRLNMYSPGKVFHAIRHTAGSVMLESGASIIHVQKQLRHTSATTTLNIYGHVLGDSQREAVNKLARAFVP